MAKERGVQQARRLRFAPLGMKERGARALLLFAIALMAISAPAQVLKDNTHPPQPEQMQPPAPPKPKKLGPRALAVVEFLPGGQARLVPVALWINDRFYDASLYAANPAPMAVQPETVYEVSDFGQPTGLFTVTTPEQIKGNWIAAGKWKPDMPMDIKLAQQAAKAAKVPAKPKPFDVNSDRPILKRSGDSSGQAGSSKGGQSTSRNDNTPPPDEPPDRPILKKPESETQPQAPAANTMNASASMGPSPDESDPNRPVLRRGAPEQKTSTPDLTVIERSPVPTNDPMQRGGRHSFVAISDAGPYEPRTLLYAMNASERSDKADQLRALAIQEIQKFIATHKTPTLPKNATINDYDLRSYDLDFTNSPTFVLSAKLPVSGAKSLRGGEFDYFVTVVAHEDINGLPIKIFSSVSDSNHLDVFPRMEIIDAVQADVNGRSDLLFRQYSDTGVNYSLYRVFPYDMEKVFEGGSPV